MADAAPAPAKPVAPLAAVRTTTAPGPGYPRYVMRTDGMRSRPLLADPHLDTWFNNPAWRT